MSIKIALQYKYLFFQTLINVIEKRSRKIFENTINFPTFDKKCLNFLSIKICMDKNDKNLF